MPGTVTRGIKPKASDYSGDGYGKQGKQPYHHLPNTPGPGTSTSGHQTGQGSPGKKYNAKNSGGSPKGSSGY